MAFVEYFKGIPIYVVQLKANPRNFGAEQYFKIIGLVDHICSGWIQYFDNAIGFGHQWIMQGSIKDAGKSEEFENYIFFEKDQAVKFTRRNGRKIARYSGGRTTNKLNLEFMVRKPKILVYNLEDFLEDWEDKLLERSFNNNGVSETLFDCKATHFIPPSSSSNEISNFSKDSKSSTIQKFSRTLNVKYRILKHAVGVFFSV